MKAFCCVPCELAELGYPQYSTLCHNALEGTDVGGGTLCMSAMHTLHKTVGRKFAAFIYQMRGEDFPGISFSSLLSTNKKSSITVMHLPTQKSLLSRYHNQ